MALYGSFLVRTFTFGFDARTSRGRMTDRRSWFLKVADRRKPEMWGYGECAPLPGLSVDDVPDFEKVLDAVVGNIGNVVLSGDIPQQVYNLVPTGFPSIQFGLETAFFDLLQGGKRLIFDNDFVRGVPIPINGLVWMADGESMLKQVHALVAKGFSCIKVKVGGLDFEVECALLQEVRQSYGSDVITLRLDANGAFGDEEALDKLERLSTFSIHSIEQPVKPGSSRLAEICQRSPIPVALDEELIGNELAKQALLERSRPSFIVLKPSLHGGIYHCREWIAIAERLGIGWWITSALESSIGLNAISQFTAEYPVTIPQGLGTGSIYTNNIPAPLRVSGGGLWYDPSASWDVNF